MTNTPAVSPTDRPAPAERPVRLAVIGAGKLGRFHAKLAAASRLYQLVAVCDPCRASRDAVAAEVAADQPGVRPAADYRGAIDRVEAAVVATPTVTHHAIGADLLSRGVHCLIEKPVTASAAEANALVEAADAGGLVLQVGHVERFNPALALAGDDVRDPRYITASRTSGYSFRSTDIGCVLDMMIHDIDLALALAGSPVSGVSAKGLSVLGDHEDVATAELTFASGCVARLDASRVSYRPQREMQVFTDRCFTAIDFSSRRVTRVQPRDEVLRREFCVAGLDSDRRDALRQGLFDELLVRTTADAPAVNAIDLEQAEFARAIRAGVAPQVTGAVGRDAVVVAEQVLAAIQQHAWDGSRAGRTGPFAAPISNPTRRAG